MKIWVMLQLNGVKSSENILLQLSGVKYLRFKFASGFNNFVLLCLTFNLFFSFNFISYVMR